MTHLVVHEAFKINELRIVYHITKICFRYNLIAPTFNNFPEGMPQVPLELAWYAW